ncbi:hypothetical protein EDEG_02266 [Edhazardia aedis USNM 41457]|uniref:Uncharacterized protein n=1 Tax=Edhazardia aedis (strain USNM 41457) TaxID=1003232 RepID=J9D7A4_EDHAE|nr:hypothetical protein EDEG_02266 [Edhazardia aedis USNM 41457]|eukprot:EJW03409.1 hypothetical protein EDEG_02266 [Edhazardia aedis USNM 41457]
MEESKRLRNGLLRETNDAEFTRRLIDKFWIDFPRLENLFVDILQIVKETKECIRNNHAYLYINSQQFNKELSSMKIGSKFSKVTFLENILKFFMNFDVHNSLFKGIKKEFSLLSIIRPELKGAIEILMTEYYKIINSSDREELMFENVTDSSNEIKNTLSCEKSDHSINSSTQSSTFDTHEETFSNIFLNLLKDYMWVLSNFEVSRPILIFNKRDGNACEVFESYILKFFELTLKKENNLHMNLNKVITRIIGHVFGQEHLLRYNRFNQHVDLDVGIGGKRFSFYYRCYSICFIGISDEFFDSIIKKNLNEFNIFVTYNWFRLGEKPVKCDIYKLRGKLGSNINRKICDNFAFRQFVKSHLRQLFYFSGEDIRNFVFEHGTVTPLLPDFESMEQNDINIVSNGIVETFYAPQKTALNKYMKIWCDIVTILINFRIYTIK